MNLFTLTFQLEEVGEVIFFAREVRTGRVGYGGKEDTLLGIASGHLLGIEGGQRGIPQSEQVAYLAFGYGLAHCDLLRHYRGMMMLDLPLSVLLDVIVGVSRLDLVARRAHGELVYAGIRCPSIADVDVARQYLAYFTHEARCEVQRGSKTKQMEMNK